MKEDKGTDTGQTLLSWNICRQGERQGTGRLPPDAVESQISGKVPFAETKSNGP